MRSRRRWLLIVVPVIVAAVALTLQATRSESAVQDAKDLVEDRSRFATGNEAAETLARVGGILQEEGTSCDRRESRCLAVLSGAGYAQVLAVRVLFCTAPGRAEARSSMATVLDDISEIEDGDPVPDPPLLPICG